MTHLLCRVFPLEVVVVGDPCKRLAHCETSACLRLVVISIMMMIVIILVIMVMMEVTVTVITDDR